MIELNEKPVRGEGTASWVSEWMLRLHIDVTLLGLILMLCTIGLFVLYSASGQNPAVVWGQFNRLCFGLVVMLLVAQISPETLRALAPWAYVGGTVLLVLVQLLGSDAKGAQRWLDLGVIRFQPSEIMKLAVPVTVAAFLHQVPLPPRYQHLLLIGLLIAIPSVLVGIQPDLGTALLIAVAGGFALFLGGLRWRIIIGLIVLAIAAAPVLWSNMHEYQQRRVQTFLDPESDPTGAGYHITQSKIAIGSGGLFGKGWLNGTQAHLDFLPESATDFVFAVYAEEFGLLGVIALLMLYLLIVGRGTWIAIRGQDSFQRIVAGSLSMTFFVYVFVNIGMVIGLLPVVGVPLPLLSYGGTSMVTLLAAFGMLMSIQTHRKLLAQ